MRVIEMLHSSGLNFPTNESLLEVFCLNDLKLIGMITTLSKMDWI